MKYEAMNFRFGVVSMDNHGNVNWGAMELQIENQEAFKQEDRDVVN